MFNSEALQETIGYIFYQCISFLTQFVSTMSDGATQLFDDPAIVGVLWFFQSLSGGLMIIGFGLTIFEFAIAYQDGKAGSFKTTGLNIIKTVTAWLLFLSIPILIYRFSVNMYEIISKVLTEQLKTEPDLMTFVQAAGEKMLSDFVALHPVGGIVSKFKGVWDFLTNLGSGDSSFLSTGIINWTLIIQVIVMIYVFIKVFFGNLKRGGILLIILGCGVLHFLGMPRGYMDGFTSWCKQVVALSFTAFMQNIMLTLGAIMFQTIGDNVLVALGVMLAAAEVPRLAQIFGLDTSTRGNIGSAVHTASSTMMIMRMFR